MRLQHISLCQYDKTTDNHNNTSATFAIFILFTSHYCVAVTCVEAQLSVEDGKISSHTGSKTNQKSLSMFLRWQ